MDALEVYVLYCVCVCLMPMPFVSLPQVRFIFGVRRDVLFPQDIHTVQTNHSAHVLSMYVCTNLQVWVWLFYLYLRCVY